jgi:hypothetical protein
MEAILVTAGSVVVAAFLVRVTVRFIRWSGKHPGSSFGDYLGEWVDGVSESPPWFPFEGTGGDHESPYDDGD